MNAAKVVLHEDIRVWQDDRLGQLWRVAYRDGDNEMVVTFPDTAAMGDFIAERLGLYLEEEEGALV